MGVWNEQVTATDYYAAFGVDVDANLLSLMMTPWSQR